MRILQLLIWFLLAVLTGTMPATAAPAIAAVAAFVSSPLGQIVIGVVGLAIQTVVGLAKRGDQAQRPDAPLPGTRQTVALGNDGPLTFHFGFSATAGRRFYYGSWGTSGSAPNAYLVEARKLGDRTLPGRPVIWVNKQKCTIDWDAVAQPQGYPVLEYRANGVDHLWVKYREGSEQITDAYMLDKFGSDAEWPWQDDMVGVGTPHVIVTALTNRELFQGSLEYLFEVPIAHWYDLRQDSTNGGSGLQRWDNPETWGPSENLPVICYNLLRGVYQGETWLFGGQNLPAFMLPAASFIAAANEADAAMAIDQGTEPQFRAGGEVECNLEPLAVVEELLKGCNGYLSESGGVFKIQVGAPGSAVYAFTDGDMAITKGETPKPFPTLNDTYNRIEGSAPSPDEHWITTPLPARTDATYEVADGNRRLPANVNFRYIPYRAQCQRVMATMLESERRFRVHQLHLPPDAWVLEPGVDVAAWTSDKYDYAGKSFMLIDMVGDPGMTQLVTLLEVDPADHTPAADYLKPDVVGVLKTVRPTPQEVSGFRVDPAIADDSDGQPRRAGYDVFWSSASVAVDVDFVRVSHRLTGETVARWVGLIPPPQLHEGSARITEALIPNETFEVQIEYVAGSGRATVESGWLPVLIPNVGLTDSDLAPFLQDKIDFVDQAVRLLHERIIDLDQTLASQASWNRNTYVRQGESLAAVVRQTEAVLDADFAKASDLTLVEARVDDVDASGLFGVNATVDQGAGEALIQLAARVQSGDTIVTSGLGVGVSGGIGYVLIDADKTILTGTMVSLNGAKKTNWDTGFESTVFVP